MSLKTWLSAAEIAALALPGLPAFKRGVVRHAERVAWKDRAGLTRPRAGRGGGFEYSIDLLPAEARAAYVAAHIGSIELPAAIARAAAGEEEAAGLSGAATDGRDARLALMAMAGRCAREAKLSRKRADRHFADLYNEGKVDAAAWIRAEVKSLTARTLQRWRAAVKAERSARLAVDRGASRRGTSLLDRANGGEVKTYLLALIAKQPQLTALHLRALCADRYPDGLMLNERAIALPPLRSFQRALKQWRNAYRNELKSIRDPDGFKSAVRFAARVARPAAAVNELWQIDASPADVLCTDGRHSLYLCEDIYSRRLVGLVSRTPRAAAVGLLLRKAILAWGVPERVKTDNGPDFVARETQRLFAALAIEHDPAAPFRPEQKGHVERAIGTLQRGLMRTLEGFIGHSVADRKAIEGRRSFARRLGEAPEAMFEVSLSAADLQARVDQWCEIIYGHAPHASLQGQSPFAAAACWQGSVRRIADARALDMLLAPVAGKDGMRTVTKTGLRIDGAHYLAGFLNVGDSVHVRMDPADMGRAYVFSADRLEFLGLALAPELAGIDPAAAIAAARAEQKRIIDERLGPAKAEARRIKPGHMADAIHRQALIAAGKLAEFPKRAAAHDTEELRAAAAAARDEAPAPSFPAEIAAMAARLRAEQTAARAAAVTPLYPDETPQQRFKRARALEARVAQGQTVSADDLLWLGGYREGPEYRGYALTYGAPTQTPAQAGPARS